jgi:hypothetical protein
VRDLDQLEQIAFGYAFAASANPRKGLTRPAFPI